MLFKAFHLYIRDQANRVLKMKWLLSYLFMFLCFFLSADEQPEKKQEQKKEIITEKLTVTSHSMVLNGETINYKATAGTLFFKDGKGDLKGEFFFVAYNKEEKEENTTRPITFCFNGGPGSSAVWLHMGVMGPKRIQIRNETFSPPPYKIIDNDYSFLDVTDLVFIDPISTGYSRAIPGEDEKQFHGVEEDIKSVGEFIRLYTTRFNRWNSPKFVLGESYGTTRAAGLSAHLHDDLRMYLNGVILVSAVLNFQTLDDENPGNDLSYILYLPTFAATAWYHHKLDKELQKDLMQTLNEVEKFALTDYATALLMGDALNPEKREEIVEAMSRYTGLSEDFIDKANLRVCESRFSKELLKEEGKGLGRFDSRYVGIVRNSCGEITNFDPSLDAVFGNFTAAFNSYVRQDLQWEKDDEYKVLANVSPWNYGKATNKYLNVTDNLRAVMMKNPALRVYVASGYFDLAVPYLGSDYTFNHLGLDKALKGHIQRGYYHAGHMMYLDPASLKQFKDEVGTFITKTVAEAAKENKMVSPSRE